MAGFSNRFVPAGDLEVCGSSSVEHPDGQVPVYHQQGVRDSIEHHLEHGDGPVCIFLRLLEFRYVNADFHDEGRAIRVGKGEVKDIVVTTVRTSPLPMVGAVGLKNRVGLAGLTRLGTTKQPLEAAPPLRFPEPLTKVAVEEGYGIFPVQEYDVGRQHIQYVMQPLPLLLGGLFTPSAFDNFRSQGIVDL